MTRKKSRLSDRHRRGARARKDRNALHVAKYRAAKAAALREEVGNIQEDVVPYEHKGGEVGDIIRLRRMNPSSGSLRGAYATEAAPPRSSCDALCVSMGASGHFARHAVRTGTEHTHGTSDVLTSTARPEERQRSTFAALRFLQFARQERNALRCKKRSIKS